MLLPCADSGLIYKLRQLWYNVLNTNERQANTMPLMIVRNDITKMAVDAIVNAAKNSLLGGGGVDGCIHRAAGPGLLAECRTLGGCPTGEAKITGGYDLPSKYVIHTVGPVWQGGGRGEREALASCYARSLALAREYGCETVAFPLISSGSYGYPKAQALEVAAQAIGAFLTENEITVYLVIFDRVTLEVSAQRFTGIRQYIDDHYVNTHTDTSRRSARQALDAIPRLPDLIAPENGAAPAAIPQAGSRVRPQKGTGHRPMTSSSLPALNEILGKLDESFSQTLLRLIDDRGMTDAQCYKKANIDRKLFSKIRSDPNYRPSKPTVLAFAIALELSLEETRDMLMKAGFALSHSNKFDLIVEYFIVRGNYNIYEINEALFAFDQNLLGA